MSVVRRALPAIKLALTAGVLVWLYLRLRDDFAGFRLRDVPVHYGILLFSQLIFIGYRFTSAGIWLLLTRWHNVHIGAGVTVAVWCYSILGKYIPGKAMLWIARYDEYRRRRENIDAAALLRCFFLEYFCSVAAGFVLLLLSLPLLDNPPLHPAARWAAAGMALLCLGASHPGLMRIAEERLGRKLGLTPARQGIGMSETLWVIGLFMLNWLALGASIFFIARALRPELGFESFLYVSASYTFAGLAGSLALFAPSGIGVREAVLIAAMTPLMDVQSATVLAVLSRIISTLGEGIVAGVSVLLLHTALRPASAAQKESGPATEGRTADP